MRYLIGIDNGGTFCSGGIGRVNRQIAQVSKNTYTVNDKYNMLDMRCNPDSDIIYAGDGDGLTEIEATLSAHSPLPGSGRTGRRRRR